MNNRFRIILFLSYLLANFATVAQDTTSIKRDRAFGNRTYQSIDTSLHDWKASRDFNYIYYLDSLLRKQPLKADTIRLDNKTGGKLTESTNKENASFIEQLLNFKGAHVFFWLLALFFIGVIIYIVFIQSGFFSFGRNRKNSFSDYKRTGDLIPADSYDQLIYEAEKSESYNVATRYWFLKTLRNLKDLELIRYSADKTNQEYISQLKESPIQDQFREITQNYEYVWYGEFFLKKELYLKIKNSFVVFNEQLMLRP